MFKELNALRKAPPTVAISIDGVKEDVPAHFGNIYSTFYNSADDDTELNLVHENLLNLKLTTELLKEDACKLKPVKSDPIYSFSSGSRCGRRTQRQPGPS